ncbi:Qat anti-phage system associated protein QatB [Roseovarius sp. SCSIO 43702]|uniref:Qat anti-phage system associated protein QatB n=1 Tax=Roseovarius sp. SCSIO 43702 TaxID=2823043 RepID=UPI002877CE5E|nr:Qat anti-phage system associated protein QatB [Roseovarius sp. SCSIO 43702]
MGTSNAFGGASGGTPLVPSWLDGDGDGEAGGDAPDGDGAPADGGDDDAPDVTPSGPPAAPADRPPVVLAPTNDRFRSARSNFTRFAGSGGSDRRSLGRAVSQYVSRSAGGAGSAARRMGSSRNTASGLLGFLGNARANGAQEALRSLNLESLAGRPVEEIFAGLADYVCPDGGSIDEGIARDAFIETIADLADAGITDIDGLTSGQIQTVFELYASHTIEARICNDIGTRVVTMPADARTVESIESQLSEFIQRGVSDAVNASGVDIGALSQDQVSSFVDSVYEAAFEMLEALGESEAEP